MFVTPAGLSSKQYRRRLLGVVATEKIRVIYKFQTKNFLNFEFKAEKIEEVYNFS